MPGDAPLRYDPSFEQPEKNEAWTAWAIIGQMRSILETTYANYGHAERSVHAKSHGLLRGEMRVMHDLPETLAQGIFAMPRTYPVVLHMSTNPGNILDDSISVPRALAIKVVGVKVERLPGSEGEDT